MDQLTICKKACLADYRAVARWRESSLILADAYLDYDQVERSDHRRRKARTRRSPGCQWPRAGLVGLTGEGARTLSDHQHDQLAHALSRPFGLLTGTPGTGKTFVTARVIRGVLERYGIHEIAACAPTGKAAVRLTSVLRGYNVPVQARTIHSLLEIGRNGHDGEGWGFQRNESNPLAERFVIVDESSMLDCGLAASLFRACAAGTHVLLVGDPYQLPPVGHGAPLRDLIAAGVPCGRLSEIRRNAGMIVEACASIKDGEEFRVAYSANDGNLLHIEVSEPEQQLEHVRGLLTRFRQSGTFDPMWGVQVIVPTNKSGPLGRREVNRALQTHLNAGGVQAPPNPFKVGDKIICTRNQWCQGYNDGRDYYVANGEIGLVIGVEPKVTHARFADDSGEAARHIRIPMGKPRDDEDGEGGTGADFDLGYAITCHKSQGSQWPCVIILADASPGARQVCSREWLYTAVSRAERLCVTIGREGVLQQMVRRPSLEKRKTFLVEELGRIL